MGKTGITNMIVRIGRIRGIDRIGGGTWAGRLGILGTHWKPGCTFR